MTAARGIAGGTIYQRGGRTKSRYYHYYHLISRCIVVLKAFCVRFSPVRAVNSTKILFESHDDIDRSSLACARTWERTPSNNGHHVMRSSNQREAFIIAPATTATATSISPWGRYWKCTFAGKYAFSTPSIVTAILQVMPRQVVTMTIYNWNNMIIYPTQCKKGPQFLAYSHIYTTSIMFRNCLRSWQATDDNTHWNRISLHLTSHSIIQSTADWKQNGSL